MNWCDYLITCLNRTKKEWTSAEPFNGPLLFLALLYCHEKRKRYESTPPPAPTILNINNNYILELDTHIYEKGNSEDVADDETGDDDEQTDENEESLNDVADDESVDDESEDDDVREEYVEDDDADEGGAQVAGAEVDDHADGEAAEAGFDEGGHEVNEEGGGEEGATGLDEFSPSMVEVDQIQAAGKDGDEEPPVDVFDRPHPCDLLYPIGSYTQRVIDETYTPLTMNGVSAYTHSVPPQRITIVFMTQTDTEFYKVMFESLFPTVYVHIGVLEAMMHVLNEEVKQRAPGSSFRFFLTPKILPLPLLVKDVPEKQRKDLLNETMTLVLSNLKINHITKVDMIFIPIIKSEHVFLLVLDLKIPSFELFDNMVIGDESVDRYEQIPTYLVIDVFVNYLLDKDHPNAYKLYQQTPKIPDLPWKTTKNGEDCGIFCMRHMETNMGGGVKGWKCGLLQESDGQRRQLQQLRIKYLCKILTSTVNILKDDIIVQAREHDTLDRKKKQSSKTIKKMIKSRQTKFL
ncbi:hypothetical protein R6Q57_002233 [Mikania cordata]